MDNPYSVIELVLIAPSQTNKKVLAAYMPSDLPKPDLNPRQIRLIQVETYVHSADPVDSLHEGIRTELRKEFGVNPRRRDAFDGIMATEVAGMDYSGFVRLSSGKVLGRFVQRGFLQEVPIAELVHAPVARMKIPQTGVFVNAQTGALIREFADRLLRLAP